VPEPKPHPSSFRDPSGSLFLVDGRLFRQIQSSYRPHYERLRYSGLYDQLVADGLLIPHKEVPHPVPLPGEVIQVLQPAVVPFVSYPYEWCFGHYRAAALALLSIQLKALQAGMTLKDASAYNIQWYQARPTLIDTLSFECYVEGRPWAAYRQFCEHLLAPVLLMSRRDVRLGQLMRWAIDGVPLALASRLLPLQTWLNPGVLLHLHLHARAQVRYRAATGRDVRRARVTKRSLLALIEHLRRTVEKSKRRPLCSTWSGYYAASSYSPAAAEHKAEIVREYLDRSGPACVWDLGANDGRYSRLASKRGAFTVAFDGDFDAVETAFLVQQQQHDANFLPLFSDLANPAPAQGWAHEERQSLVDRGPADLVMALAVVHHLAIGNNAPLDRIARFFSSLTRQWLIVEFVPKDDSQVQRLLATRQDVFGDYNIDGFQRAFDAYFARVACTSLRESKRHLCLLRKRP
jgi:hypothetical protein